MPAGSIGVKESFSLVLQGLEKGIDYKKVLKAFKKDFCCNGTVVEDTELGQASHFTLCDTLWSSPVQQPQVLLPMSLK